MKASIALSRSPRGRSRYQPSGGGEDESHGGAILMGASGSARRSSATSAPTSSPSAAARTSRRADDDAVGARGGRRGRLLGGARCRSRARPGRRCAPWRGRRSASASQRCALAGRADRPRPRRGTRARAAPIAASRSSGVVGATSGTSAIPASSQAASSRRRLLERQVGDDQPADARARASVVGERLGAAGQTRLA